MEGYPEFRHCKPSFSDGESSAIRVRESSVTTTEDPFGLKATISIPGALTRPRRHLEVAHLTTVGVWQLVKSSPT